MSSLADDEPRPAGLHLRPVRRIVGMPSPERHDAVAPLPESPPTTRPNRHLWTHWKGDRLGRAVASTSALNLAATAASALTGLLIARLLGPSIRGEYAAITAWYGAALVAGELGQPAAICYFVAHHPGRAAEYVTTSRDLMVGSGTMMAIVGWFVAPHLSTGAASVTFGYRLMFIVCPVIYAGASYSFALQSRSIHQWALIRAVQPAAYLLGAATLIATGRLGLRNVLLTLVASSVLQVLLARVACRRKQVTGGRYSRALRGKLLRYGVTQILATAPTTVNLTLDQLVLSQAVSSASLGRYAVAVSMTMLAYPLVSPIGSVLFPHLAAQSRESAASRRLQYRAVIATATVSAGVMGVVAATSSWLVPTLLGSSYRSAVPLVWILSPGGILVPCNQVMGDLLRGRNQTVQVAVAQGVGAVVTIVLLIVLVPRLGARGAAVTSDLAYAASFGVLLKAMTRHPPAPDDRSAPGAGQQPDQSGI